MLTREQYEELINGLKAKLDDTTQALVSEDLINLMSNYVTVLDELSSKDESLTKLISDNEELLKVNGRLFQKLGFENKEEEKQEELKTDEEIKIEDVINEKGDLI